MMNPGLKLDPLTTTALDALVFAKAPKAASVGHPRESDAVGGAVVEALAPDTPFIAPETTAATAIPASTASVARDTLVKLTRFVSLELASLTLSENDFEQK